MEGRFNYAKKGYEPAEVDRYIDQLESVLSSYKEKDAAIKNALISAEIAASDILKNAELEAAKITERAVAFLENISSSITDQKKLVQDFQEEYSIMFNKYVRAFNEGETMQMYAKINELEDYIVKLQSTLKATQEA